MSEPKKKSTEYNMLLCGMCIVCVWNNRKDGEYPCNVCEKNVGADCQAKDYGLKFEELCV